MACVVNDVHDTPAGAVTLSFADLIDGVQSMSDLMVFRHVSQIDTNNI